MSLCEKKIINHFFCKNWTVLGGKFWKLLGQVCDSSMAFLLDDNLSSENYEAKMSVLSRKLSGNNSPGIFELVIAWWDFQNDESHAFEF